MPKLIKLGLNSKSMNDTTYVIPVNILKEAMV